MGRVSEAKWGGEVQGGPHPVILIVNSALCRGFIVRLDEVEQLAGA